MPTYLIGLVAFKTEDFAVLESTSNDGKTKVNIKTCFLI